MKRFGFLVLLAVCLTMVVGVPAAAQDGRPDLLIWADNTREKALTPLVEQFSAEFGVTVRVDEIGMGDIRANLPVAGPAGEGPDIIIAAHDWIGELVLNGSVVPIDLGDKAAEFSPASLSLFTYYGELYGMPYAVENVAFLRNTDLVPDAPATWDEVKAITEELVSSGTSEFGYLIQTNDAYHYFPIMSAYGGYVFGLDENGNYNPEDVGIDSPGAIAAAEWLQSMAEAGYLVADVNYDVMHAKFESGEAAMIITGPWAMPERIRPSGIPYAISDLPAGPAGPGRPFIGGQGFMISAYSQNQLLAEAFLLDFMANTEPMQAMYDADPRPPAYLPVLESLADPDFEAFRHAGLVGVPQPSIPQMSSVWGAWGNAQQFTITQELDGATAFTDAAAQIRDLIAGRVTGATTSETGEYVGLPGTIQEALGCPGNWQPECENTRMVVGEDDGVWQAAFDLPAGSYEYKAALNGTWDVNYGLGGEAGGANIVLNLDADTNVVFLFDPISHWVADSVNSLIVSAPGSYQAALGCPGDWSPDCLLSWMQDADGDGIYSFSTDVLPAGDYEVKAALNQSWDVNYGADGEAGGANIPFTVTADNEPVTFSFDSSTNLLTVAVGG